MKNKTWKDDEWNEQPPKNDGDFFYFGNTPDGEEIVAIVQVVTNIENGDRLACLFIPSYWHGDVNRTRPTIHSAKLNEWGGQWSGPEYGLCCATQTYKVGGRRLNDDPR